MDADIYSSYSTNYTQKALFFKESEKIQIKMSDGAELYSYYTKNGNHPHKISIFFVPGWSTAPFSWNDTWDHLYNTYDLYVLETREKKNSKLDRNHKGDMNRHAKDLYEAMVYYELDPSRTVFMGPCFGAGVIARAIALKLFEPALTMFFSPTIRFPMPRFLLPVAYIFPSNFAYNFIVKPILKVWAALNTTKGIQRRTYFENFNNGKGENWIKGLSLVHYNTLEDYAKVNVPSIVFGTKSDRVHKDGEAVKIADTIPTGEYIDVKSYYFMHHNPGSKCFVEIINEKIQQIVLSETPIIQTK